MLCNTAEEEKIAAKRHFLPKAHKTGAAAHIDKIAAQSVHADTPIGMEVKR